MKIYTGSDEAGFKMKEEIIGLLKSFNHEVVDCGCYDENAVLYPEVAIDVAERVAAEPGTRGILICGTGIGMAMSANKVKGIRAAVCHDVLSTERSILSNNAQVMCMGARIISPYLAKKFVEIWMQLQFVDGSSTPKVRAMIDYENEGLRQRKA